MKKLLYACFILSLVGCSTTPMKDLTKDQLLNVFTTLSGKYKVIDSRENKYTKISHVELFLNTARGEVTISQDEGSQRQIHLSRCSIANTAQAENSGDPIESLEILVMCNIVSDYKWATLYVGKVKSNYVISDQKLLKSFTPMAITAGYFVTINQFGTSVFLNAAKE